MNLCEVCQKNAFRKCGGCRKVVYCTKQHQKDDWARHRRVCRAFKVCDGAHLSATRDLSPGDGILQEASLIWGPCATTAPVCLGCGKSLGAETSRPCLKCGWPVCDDLCAKSPSHLPECRYTAQRGERVVIQRFGVPHPVYKCVTVLRCLYVKQFLPKIWTRLENLKPVRERRDNEWVKIAEFIRRFFKLYTVFSLDEVVDVCGLVMINSREVPVTQPPYVAIFGTASLLEHNCSANCTISFTNLGHIVVSAAKTIKEGDHLTVSYADPLWGTSSRRYHLYHHRFVWCYCQRCQDPTEFGTNFSALKCQTTCDGCLLPPNFTDLQKTPDWVCDVCGRSVSSYWVYDILERVEKDLSELDKNDVEGCKQFLTTCRGLLHENHFFCTRVKYFLALFVQTRVEALSDEDLVAKLEFCQDLEGLVKVLAPAEKRVLGRVLFAKSVAVAELGRRSDSGKLVFSLNESKRSLEEVVDLLKNEPEVLPEGEIRVAAAKNLEEVGETLRRLTNG